MNVSRFVSEQETIDAARGNKPMFGYRVSALLRQQGSNPAFADAA
jgi:hypothetical protein